MKNYFLNKKRWFCKGCTQMHTQTQNKSKRGFTLIEVMVVTIVMGVLAAVGVPKIFGIVERSKEKIDLMKLFYLRDALNRALIESEEALYQSSYVTSGKDAAKNLSALKTKLKSESGVDLFVIEMRPDMHTNIQHNHPSINKDSEMSKIIGQSGVWYDALRDAGFNGVADILSARNTPGTDLSKDGDTYYAYSYKSGSNTYYRTYPKEQLFISKELNNGKSSGLSGITSQGSNKTNYRLTASIQWTGGTEASRSIEVALLPAGGKMMTRSGKGGALLTEHGVCFSTYGDVGCADYSY